jgi:hypothetical protein
MSGAVTQSRSPSDSPLRMSTRVHRFSVGEYEQMGELGFLKVEDRVELLEGWIIDKMIQYPPHAAAIDFVSDALRARLPNGWRLRDQNLFGWPRDGANPGTGTDAPVGSRL